MSEALSINNISAPRYGASAFVPAAATFLIYKIVQKAAQVAAQRFAWMKNYIEALAILCGGFFGERMVEWLLPHLFAGNPVLANIATIINILAILFIGIKTLVGSELVSAVSKATSFVTNMTTKGAEYTPLHGRDSVWESMERILHRPRGLRSMILVGEPSSEPELIAEECARRIVSNSLDRGSPFLNKKIYFVNASLLASIDLATQQKELAALSKIGDVVLFVDRFELVTASELSWTRSLLGSYITSGQITVVGITSRSKYSQVQSLPFSSSLSPVQVDPTQAEPCFLALQAKNEKRSFTQDCPHITVTDGALALATLFSYHHVIKGFALKDAVVLLSDTVFSMRNRAEPTELNADLFMQYWRAIYRESPTKVSLASLDETAQQFFRGKGLDVGDIIRDVTGLNKLKKDAHLSQVDIPLFLRDMNEEAREGKYPPCIGREEEIRSVLRTLRQPKNKSLVLLGEPGIGKTAIFEEIARRIATGDRSVAVLTGKTLYWVDVNALLSNEGRLGQLNQSVTSMIDFCRERKGDAILVIDELHVFRGAGRYHGNDTDLFEMVKNALARDDIIVLGTANDYKWKPITQEDPAIERRIKSRFVEPPSAEVAIQMLMHTNQAGFYTQGYEPVLVEVTPEAVQAAVTLSEQYMRGKFLPDKATVLIAQTVAYFQDEQERQFDRVAATQEKRKITCREIALCLYDSVKGTLKQKTTKEEFARRVLHLQASAK